MNTASKITLALAASMGLSAVATAQPRHAPPAERVVGAAGKRGQPDGARIAIGQNEQRPASCDRAREADGRKRIGRRSVNR